MIYASSSALPRGGGQKREIQILGVAWRTGHWPEVGRNHRHYFGLLVVWIMSQKTVPPPATPPGSPVPKSRLTPPPAPELTPSETYEMLRAPSHMPLKIFGDEGVSCAFLRHPHGKHVHDTSVNVSSCTLHYVRSCGHCEGTPEVQSLRPVSLQWVFREIMNRVMTLFDVVCDSTVGLANHTAQVTIQREIARCQAALKATKHKGDPKKRKQLKTRIKMYQSLQKDVVEKSLHPDQVSYLMCPHHLERFQATPLFEPAPTSAPSTPDQAKEATPQEHVV